MRRVLLSFLLAVAVAGPGVTGIGVAEAADATVTFADRATPAALTVAPGTRVTFANQSGARKRVRSEDGPAEFDSGNLESGASWSVVLEAAGTYAYVDDRDRDDPAYHGTITVSTVTPPAGGGGSAPSPSAPPAGSPAPSAPTTASVALLDRSFSPGTVTVAAGGTVSWTNQSDRDHTVTGTGFDSGVLGGGGRYSHTFPSAGTFSYICSFHPEMTGVLTVAPAAAGSARAAGPGPLPTAAGATAAPDSPTTTTAPPAAEEPIAEPAEVSIVDFAFEPATTRLAVGGTVTWRHNGRAPHTVSASDASFDSGLLQPGGVFSHRFDQAGIYEYVCAFHPEMVGTVEVADTPSTAADDGAVAPGEQAVSTVNADAEAASSNWGALLAAVVGAAALLAGFGAFLYGGSRMVAAGER